jgi:hypothetical protein
MDLVSYAGLAGLVGCSIWAILVIAELPRSQFAIIRKKKGDAFMRKAKAACVVVIILCIITLADQFIH